MVPFADVDPAGQKNPGAVVQLEQDAASAGINWPVVHSCLSLAPPAQACPASHAMPAADVEFVGQKNPGAAVHGEQGGIPVEEKLPALHVTSHSPEVPLTTTPEQHTPASSL